MTLLDRHLLKARRHNPPEFNLPPLSHFPKLDALPETACKPERYFDRLMIGFPAPPSDPVERLLRLGSRRVKHFDQPDGSVLVRVSRPLPEMLAELPPLKLTSGEVTLDLAFQPHLIDLASKIAVACRVIPFHRAAQVVVLVEDQSAYFARKRYLNGDRRPSVSLVYLELESRRLPGSDLPCIHFEERRVGARAMAATGLATTTDAANFDHRQFWMNRLKFVVIDPARIGGTLVRRGWTCGDLSGDRLARRVGHAILSRHDVAQSLIHQLGRVTLDSLDIGPWLP